MTSVISNARPAHVISHDTEAIAIAQIIQAAVDVGIATGGMRGLIRCMTHLGGSITQSGITISTASIHRAIRGYRKPERLRS